MDRIELRRSAIDLEVEYVRPIVVAGKVVPELHLNAKLEIALGIEDAFLATQGAGNNPAVGSDDDAAAAAIGIAQETL